MESKSNEPDVASEEQAAAQAAAQKEVDPRVDGWGIHRVYLSGSRILHHIRYQLIYEMKEDDKKPATYIVAVDWYPTDRLMQTRGPSVLPKSRENHQTPRIIDDPCPVNAYLYGQDRVYQMLGWLKEASARALEEKSKAVVGEALTQPEHDIDKFDTVKDA